MFPAFRCHQLAPGRCQQCGRTVVFVRRLALPNHKLHALLSLVTGGAWIAGWLWCCWRAGERTWECTECGHCCTRSLSSSGGVLLMARR